MAKKVKFVEVTSTSINSYPITDGSFIFNKTNGNFYRDSEGKRVLINTNDIVTEMDEETHTLTIKTGGGAITEERQKAEKASAEAKAASSKVEELSAQVETNTVAAKKAADEAKEAAAALSSGAITDVTYDEATGTFTFKKQDGTEIPIRTV